jgi:uncharacterized membrane-anchored protein
MKNLLLRFLVSRSGSILTPIIAAAVGTAVSRVAAFDPHLASGIDQAAITAFVVAAILSVVNYATNAAQTPGIKRIQALVNTDQDGIPGPVTYT